MKCQRNFIRKHLNFLHPISFLSDICDRQEHKRYFQHRYYIIQLYLYNPIVWQNCLDFVLYSRQFLCWRAISQNRGLIVLYIILLFISLRKKKKKAILGLNKIPQKTAIESHLSYITTSGFGKETLHIYNSLFLRLSK